MSGQAEAVLRAIELDPADLADENAQYVCALCREPMGRPAPEDDPVTICNGCVYGALDALYDEVRRLQKLAAPLGPLEEGGGLPAGPEAAVDPGPPDLPHRLPGYGGGQK